MIKKIALEEHFQPVAMQSSPPGLLDKITEQGYIDLLKKRLDSPEIRLAEMDKSGVETSILSLAAPGIQGMLDVKEAVTTAKEVNDLIYSRYVKPYGNRFMGFAALPVQDPVAAGVELTRVVKDYGFKGALINGFTNINDHDTAEYLDAERVLPFWEAVAKLDVPIYLHPRMPVNGQHKIYEGYPVLLGSAWAFAHETGTHAMRLMLSGLFDRFPNVNVILGHFGENIPYGSWRIDNRMSFHKPEDRGKQKNKIVHYLKNNFYFTTSGFHRDQALINCVSEIGEGRVLFSSDYPYEELVAAAKWFDSAAIPDALKKKIAYDNAAALFKIK